MKITVKDEDRKKLINWLQVVANYINDDDEINETLQRLYREEEYYKNFNSPEYFDYYEKHTKPIEIDGQKLDREYFKKMALKAEKKYREDEKKLKL